MFFICCGFNHRVLAKLNIFKEYTSCFIGFGIHHNIIAVFGFTRKLECCTLNCLGFLDVVLLVKLDVGMYSRIVCNHIIVIAYGFSVNRHFSLSVDLNSQGFGNHLIIVVALVLIQFISTFFNIIEINVPVLIGG